MNSSVTPLIAKFYRATTQFFLLSLQKMLKLNL